MEGGLGVSATVEQLLRLVDGIAPFELAEEWENVGLLAGAPEAKVDTEMNVIKDVTFTGPILKLADDVLAFVKTQVKEHLSWAGRSVSY